MQYNAPLFKMLHRRNRICIKVFYTWSQSASGKKYDPGFAKEVQWDIPLLNIYDHCFVNNIASEPGSHHYKGIDNPSLINEVESWNADAVLVYGWSFKSHLKAMRYFKGKIPVLFRGDSTLLDDQSFLKKIIRKIILQYVYRYVDIALYAGKANNDYLKTSGLKDEQLVFMPHAVDNERFAGTKIIEAKAAALRAQWQIPETATVFLFVGKLESKKQPLLLAEVFTALNDNNAYLFFVGSGEQEKELHKNFGTNENIKFLGFQNQQTMPVIYAACNIFVLPSRGPGETWGLSINEAMASGRAVIASTACGAVYDIIEDGINGYIVEKNNKSSLQLALKKSMADKDLLKKMGQRSKDIIKSFSLENDSEAIEKVILKTGEKKRS